MDVLAGRKIHYGVRAPFGGPAHFLDLFLDAGGDGAVTDVGVDLHQKVAPDNHRLALGVIDVGGDNRPPARDFVADKFRSDVAGDARAEGLAAQIAWSVERGACLK